MTLNVTNVQYFRADGGKINVTMTDEEGSLILNLSNLAASQRSTYLPGAEFEVTITAK